MTLLDIRRTSSANIDRFIKALICGEPGTGKTLISSTFPDPFYVTTEGLMMSVADRDVPYHKLKSEDELYQIILMLQQAPAVRAKQFGFPVKTVVIDTIDDLSTMLLKGRMKRENHDSAQLQDYGWLKDQMTHIVTALRNLEMNVVMTCHLKTQEVNGLTTFVPAIEGSFSQKIAGFVDLAVVLQTKLGTKVIGTDTVKVVERYMQTTQDHQHKFIKDHSNKLPSEFMVNFEDDYERMATLIYGKAPDLLAPEEETVSEPETEEAEPEDSPVEEEVPEEGTLLAATGRFECENCGTKFDDEDQHDRCKIKGWPILCAPCSKGRS